MRKIIIKGLREAGFGDLDFAEAVDGASALEALRKNEFDLVLSDINMPGMDGLTLLGEIKQRFPDATPAEVCRRLGVRSVVVLPLVDGDELFGISEILSPLPNAFSQFDLDILQTLADRIVERRRQDRKNNASVTPKESGPVQYKLEKVVLNANQLSALPRLDQISRKINRRTTVLGVLVIAAAMLLGLLVGWRQGWRKATLSFPTSSPVHRANAMSSHGQADHTGSPLKPAPPASVVKDECGSLGVAGQTIQPSNGGLTICEQGRVIFRSPPATVVPVRNLPTSSPSGRASANTARQ
jgi:hypothetical protein